MFATGFDAMTGALLRVDIRGRDGRTLRDAWAGGPAHATSASASPASPTCSSSPARAVPSVLTNMIVSIEQHVEWITDCMAYLRDHGYRTIEATTPPRTSGSST